MTIAEPRPRRWDPVVKLTHWAIVIGILVNALVTEDGSTAHVWVGYVIAAILALRLIWGFIGPKEARFTAFPPSPGRALAHIKDIAAGRRTEHASHNPLGALMAYAVWATLGVIVVSGILMTGLPGTPVRNAGGAQTAAISADRYEEAGEEEGAEGGEGGEGPLGELHESAVTLLYILIALHIAGVVFETRRSGRHIVAGMLPGRRQSP